MTRCDAMSVARETVAIARRAATAETVRLLRLRNARMKERLDFLAQSRDVRDCVLLMSASQSQRQIAESLKDAGIHGWTLNRVRRVIERAKKSLGEIE
jgi:hypothetical protein